MSDFEENEIILLVRKDHSVQLLQSTDPKTEIYIHRLFPEQIIQLNQEYPNFLPTDTPFIYSVNVISSQILSNLGYKKIRFYISPKGQVVRRIETGQS